MHRTGRETDLRTATLGPSLRRRFRAGIAAVFLVLPAAGVDGLQARTLRLADQGDAISMDPHSLNAGLQLSLLGNVYESLTARGPGLELVPGLARSWRSTGPRTWRFELRDDVRFHDGAAFTADDVVFS